MSVPQVLPSTSGGDEWGAQLNDAIASLHLGPGLHSAIPAAGGVPAGSLYACTTHRCIHRTNGTTWSNYLSLDSVPDRPPASANAKDDEFDGNSSATWVDTPVAPTTWDAAADSLYLRSNGNGNALVGKVQAVPSFPFTVTAKINSHTVRSGTSFAGLLALPASPSSGSPCATLGLGFSGGILYAQRLLFSALNGTAYVSDKTETAWTNVPAINRRYRWTFNSATSLTAESSQDGVHWRLLESAWNPGFSVANVGLFVCEKDVADVEMVFEFFRVT